ncbi:inorganic diphosphatase [Buchnera aphidicola (Hormaphis cornu)]|nr:inorganic diphosphatase [Buchnera aphidicola (Hormaphis cornu)]
MRGKKIPEDIFVIIEISSNANPVKYEIDKNSGILHVDRFISSNMSYPCNYGYINHTLSLDGDPLDVLVISPFSLLPGSVIQCIPVGMLKMIDESGEDYKIIAIPHPRITTQYHFIHDIQDVPKILKEQIVHFFKHYKDLEKNKWVKIIGWEHADRAKKRNYISA